MSGGIPCLKTSTPAPQERAGQDAMANRSGRLNKWCNLCPKISLREDRVHFLRASSGSGSALLQDPMGGLKNSGLSLRSGLLPRSIDSRERAVTIA